MYKNKKILGVITARGKSKGIPKKNIKLLAEKPLIYYTIKAAKESKFLNYFLVSTDDKEIAEIAKSYGAEIPFMRPAELATDTAPTLPVLKHALDFAEKYKNCRFDYILTLHPTNPLRTAQDIDNAIELAKINPDATSIISICEIGIPPQKIKKIINGKLVDYYQREIEGTLRQKYSEKIYRRNEAIYLTKRKTLIQGSIFGEKIIPYIMLPEKSTAIDNILDFELAEFLFKKQNL